MNNKEIRNNVLLVAGAGLVAAGFSGCKLGSVELTLPKFEKGKIQFDSPTKEVIKLEAIEKQLAELRADTSKRSEEQIAALEAAAKKSATIDGITYTVVLQPTVVPTVESVATAVPAVVKVEQPVVVVKQAEATAVSVVPTVEATKVTGGETTVIESFSIQGAPDRVDAKNVDTAKGDFKNTIGLGSEMILADPGVLKVGWDFPQDQFKTAGESIYHYDAGNQSVLHTPESFVNVPEGAFAMLNGNAMIIEVSGNGSASFRLEIPGPINNHNIVILRGLYRDGQSPEDRNRIAKITGYTPGAVVYDMYPKGGMLSQGHVEQIAKNALTNSPNCGAEACRTVTLYLLDENTGALSVLKTSGQGWTSVTSNWK